MTPSRSRPRVGFIGLGAMGRPMAANVARGGYELTVWRRDPSPPLALDAPGATEAASPAELAAACAVVVLCVSDGPDVLDVLFGPRALADALAPGSLVIDCSTTSPAVAEDAAARLGARGVDFVDAPVTGGTEGAERGTLTVLVGGATAAVRAAEPVLATMGSRIVHLGPAGAGQRAKAVNQVILAGTYLAVAEGVVLALRTGLDPSAVVDALGTGAAGSWVLAHRAQRMIDDEYPLGFRLALHRKDLRIALELAAGAGASLPVAALAATLEDGLIAQGYGDEDNAALARAIRALSGLAR